ncbi:folylpolyglutamate synthase [Terfezia boudieri ATCC MYA-4762]|uniref:tetrahydrofolate synthase n=1 Tax=Terfezia boudieri ATCC MYA-4762 TaxID=1051890 RepID=A0A3N4LEE2_9PEZI|nr:folylpolyglutamate synthase [Terfezia boudieri ATCC MYA-4762]
MKRTYENALKLLQTRRRTARPTDKLSVGIDGLPPVGAIPNVYGTSTLLGIPSIVGMREWLELLGHSDSDVNRLNVIHVAGTKGKGSTCAFVRSLLLAHGSRTGFPRKVGLYTSPDLRCIRERIQINEQLIPEDLFTKYFFEVWDCLSSQESQVTVGKYGMPRYLQLLALVAFHTFIKEATDAAIWETHHGGEYDSTNFIREPIVTGITTIGMDHVEQLGPTIENVAWHKAGIFKSGTPGFSVPQDPNISAVLQARAEEKKIELGFVGVNPSLPTDARALQTSAQKTNCSLALALVGAFLKRKARPENSCLTSSDILDGIGKFSWPGRFEVISEGRNEWFLDGAHNELSVKHAVECATPRSLPRILIFTHISDQRDGQALLTTLASCIKNNNIRLEYVIFTTFQERQDGSTRIDKNVKIPHISIPDLLAIYCDIWRKIDPEAVIVSEPAIEGALKFARKIGEEKGGMETLITGSLHLVGGALNILQPLN